MDDQNRSRLAAGVTARAGLLATLVIVLATSFLASSCWLFRRPGAAGNAHPRIEALYPERNGRRIRLVPPSSGVTIVARATDPNGDRLRYEWSLLPGSGQITRQSGNRVEWQVGDSVSEIRLTVRDGRGGFARRVLRVSPTDEIVFGGRVIDEAGRPIAGSRIEVGGARTSTGADGRFRVKPTDPNAERFVLNIASPGRGPISRVYNENIEGGSWTPAPATVVSANPASVITVTSAPNCQGTSAEGFDPARYPRELFPQVFDENGQRRHRFYPPELAAARAILQAGGSCAAGITVTIPANSLVGPQGSAPAGNVNVTVSTVNLYAPDDMPGDYTVRTRAGTRFMESFGAGSITVSRGDTIYQMRKGTSATIRIPIDSVRLRTKSVLPDGIPLLRYDEASGEWVQVGSARLVGGSAYEATIDHFSSFNMDLLKVDQACLRIESQQISGNYRLRIMIPQGSSPPVIRTRDVSQATEQIHALYNLPPNTWVELLAMKENASAPGTYVPIGTFVANTGDPQDPTDPNQPAFPYDACQGSVVLSDQVGPLIISYDGASHVSAPLPYVVVTLTDAATGTDIYPVGIGTLYVYGLYDTGANTIAISSTYANALGIAPYTPDIANDPEMNVRVRLGGMAKVDATPPHFGPINAPGSGAYAADVEVPNLRMGAGPASLATMLVGTPVTNRIAAMLDFRQSSLITRANFPDPGIGAQFFDPADAAIPAALLRLELAPFGPAGTTLQNATRESRLFLRNVTFQNGTNTVTDDQSVVGAYTFFIDTGTRPTFINTDVANALGLLWTTSGGGTVDCNAGRAGNEGFQITRFAVTAVNPAASGTYEVTNAIVCVDIDGNIVTANYANPNAPPAALFVDAIIGMNLFDHAPILVHPRAGFLGILPQ